VGVPNAEFPMKESEFRHHPCAIRPLAARPPTSPSKQGGRRISPCTIDSKVPPANPSDGNPGPRSGRSLRSGIAGKTSWGFGGVDGAAGGCAVVCFVTRPDSPPRRVRSTGAYGRDGRRFVASPDSPLAHRMLNVIVRLLVMLVLHSGPPDGAAAGTPTNATSLRSRAEAV
jgi:hypothetical protein